MSTEYRPSESMRVSFADIEYFSKEAAFLSTPYCAWRAASPFALA
jgi:hypothetical protein